MSIALVITRGFSNGAIVGSIKDLVTRGYDISVTIPSVWTDIILDSTSWVDESADSSIWTDITKDTTIW